MSSDLHSTSIQDYAGDTSNASTAQQLNGLTLTGSPTYPLTHSLTYSDSQSLITTSLDAAGCRCSIGAALPGSFGSTAVASRKPHARRRKGYWRRQRGARWAIAVVPAEPIV